MAASAIAISSDSSDESVGSPPSQVILFCDIPTVIPSTFVVSPETSIIAPVISSAALWLRRLLLLHPLDCVVKNEGPRSNVLRRFGIKGYDQALRTLLKGLEAPPFSYK
ncbi:hypothetical protein Tco_0826248 [Tanacetum coccineum]